jgi:hypothetical protein
VFSLYTIHFAGKNSEAAMGREHYFFQVKGYTGDYTSIFRGFFINFARTNSAAAMGRATCFYEIFWPVSWPLIFQGRMYFYYILPPPPKKKNLTW